MGKEIQLDPTRPHLLRAALDTGRPVLMERVTPEMLQGFAQSEAHLKALRALEPKSILVVPLVAHGNMLGALALISASESHTYRSSDVRLVENLAVRASLAIENARLYGLATRAIRARDEIIGIVAHDLRNPLGAILMQAAVVQAQAQGSRRPVEAIVRAAHRVNRLVNDLLDLTRLEAGHLSIEPSSLPAPSLIADVVEAQRTMASAASITLRTELPSTVPNVWADRDRLLQIFENLIGNAIKFTSPGGCITVGASAREDEVVFSVADTGAGISSDALPHVFDRFWQAGRPNRTGVGLGLSIVKGIVEAHGGRVWVESTPGHGSTFFFAIPTAPRPAQWPERRPDAAGP